MWKWLKESDQHRNCLAPHQGHSSLLTHHHSPSHVNCVRTWVSTLDRTDQNSSEIRKVQYPPPPSPASPLLPQAFVFHPLNGFFLFLNYCPPPPIGFNFPSSPHFTSSYFIILFILLYSHHCISCFLLFLSPPLFLLSSPSSAHSPFLLFISFSAVLSPLSPILFPS